MLMYVNVCYRCCVVAASRYPNQKYEDPFAKGGADFDVGGGEDPLDVDTHIANGIKFGGYHDPLAGGLETGKAFGGDRVTGVGDEEEEVDFYEGEFGESDEVNQADSWAVINSFFGGHGLVHQQIQSYDDFLQFKLQEIAIEHPPIEIRPEKQYRPDADNALDTNILYSLKFAQMWLNRPNRDGEEGGLFPQESRLRNLTYVSYGSMTV